MRLERSLILFQTIVSLFFLSCGYTKTENDKYPDMPLFPKHTNPELSIKTLEKTINSLYLYRGETFISSITYSYDNRPSEMYIVQMDRNLNVMDSIMTANGVFEIVEGGDFYSQNENGELLKHISFTQKPIVVEQHPFNGELYKEKIEKELTEGKYARGTYPDSLSSSIWKIIDSVSHYSSLREFKKQQIKGLQCVIDLYPESKCILVYDKEEYISTQQPYSTDFDDSASQILYDFKSCSVKQLVNIGNDKALLLTDEVVRYNGSSGGNHFVPGGFYPIGLQYYELEILGSKTNFKIAADPLGQRQLFLRHIPHTDIYLIDIINKSHWYNVSPTYKVELK